MPASFIGYGTFSLAAMVAFAYLIKQQAAETRWWRPHRDLWPAGRGDVGHCPITLRRPPASAEQVATTGRLCAGVGTSFAAGILLARRRIAARLPSFEVLDDVMYKSIAVSFAFFTIATVLGALWAAVTWGGYWSWDPAWALIVWLNYAAWLHMRLVKGLRGTVASWWALVRLAVTTFAFLGRPSSSTACSYGTL